ncbi:MAG: hypothetical protein FWG99_01030 [Treponema sp.]|nr:hypothetical protein [Treponema sp.]
MKKTFWKNIFLYIFVLALIGILFLTGCPNVFEPDFTDVKKPLSGEGSFNLIVDGMYAGRTILPATVQSYFALYLLVFSADGMEDIAVDRANNNLSNAITLPAGTWNLTVTAYMDSEKTKPAAQGSLTGIVISSGSNVSRSLELKAIIEAGASGTFRWNIGYPADVVSAYMSISPLDTESGTPEQLLYFIGGVPLVDRNNSASPLILNTGFYRVMFNLSNRKHDTGMEEYLHIYKNMESRFDYNFTQDHFTVYSVTNEADDGPGSLRHAIDNAVSNSTIFIENGVETIRLNSPLLINRNLVIRGNGVTITPNASWSAFSIGLMGINNTSTVVTISQIHFKDGRSANHGGAITNAGNLTLESCIFSGNNADFYGGALANGNIMNVRACTFYGNSAKNRGGAIYDELSFTTLTGNLFYGNTATIANNVGYDVSSNGFNVVDVPLGTAPDQSGWTGASTDKSTSSLPLSLSNFKPIGGGGAINVINILPLGYPTVDFYGNPINNNAAAGAIQEILNGSGYYLELTVNTSAFGSVSISPPLDVDGFVSGAVSITANAEADCALAYWLVNGVKSGNANPLTLTPANHSFVQAVFQRVVNVIDFSDSPSSTGTPGTLRYALTNALDGDIIRFSGVTPGLTVIELSDALPSINKSVVIEGNGITLTRSTSWTTIDDYSQLLAISNAEVTINRVHFKDGRAIYDGSAIYNSGVLNLESCIFSGNLSSGNTAAGTIYNDQGTLTISACTFYGNAAGGHGGAVYNERFGFLWLTGNIFYGNTADRSHPVIGHNTTYFPEIMSNGYNVVDVPIDLVDDTGSGWSAALSDKTISALPVSSTSFKLLSGSGAANVITVLPAGYPTVDFYGNPIAAGAAAGAVQSTASGSGYCLDLTVNDKLRGSVTVSPQPNADGLVTGNVTFNANAEPGYNFRYWLVNGEMGRYTSSMNLTLTDHTIVKAIFGRVITITNFSDTEGSAADITFRYALANAQDGDLIQFSGVTPELSAVELSGTLPIVTKSISIEGNGITLTRSAAWTTIDAGSRLLSIRSTGIVNISGIHFKGGRIQVTGPLFEENNAFGAAISQEGGDLILDSCIFSDNQTTGWSGLGPRVSTGGAIYVGVGNLTAKKCTFNGNLAEYGGGAIGFAASGKKLNLVQCLFKDNIDINRGGGAIYINAVAQSTVESCIFTGNQSQGISGGGAIHKSGSSGASLSVKACTFYMNSSSGGNGRGGAIYSYGGSNLFTGNIFYGNISDNVTVVSGGSSGGYNVVDAPLGTGVNQCGWTAATGDKTISMLPVSPSSFKLLSGSEAANVITSLPAAYPAEDYYDSPITSGAAAGAVQTVVSGSGYYLDLKVNNGGSISVSPLPNEDGVVSGTATLTAQANAGHDFLYWLVNGVKAGESNPLTHNVTANVTIQAIFGMVVNDFSDSAGSETTPGTLRHALTNVVDGDHIWFSGVTPGITSIELTGLLPAISSSITIEGNGVTLTPYVSWTEPNRCLSFNAPDRQKESKISRVHFKDFKSPSATAIYTGGNAVLALESCIFSGNSTLNNGSAIRSEGTSLELKGCTFYGNSSNSGGAIITNGYLTLEGNLFFNNTAIQQYPVVGGSNLYSVSGIYNVVDVPLGTGYTQSGWEAGTGDKTIGTLPVSPTSFKLLPGSSAANLIPTLSAGYPKVDFYGNPIAAGAAAGAVQSTASGSGYHLDLSVSNKLHGNVTVLPEPNADGIVSGTITLTANPAAGCEFMYWLVNSADAGNPNPLSLTMSDHTAVHAIFRRIIIVSNFSDEADSENTPGTLRHAVTNAQSGDVIRLMGVTPGVTTIELGASSLLTSQNINIEGNGIILTRSASTNNILIGVINGANADISRVHFKGGRIYPLLSSGNLTLESCIFSDIDNTSAIYSSGSITVNGCTFFGDFGITVTYGTRLTLAGNLFTWNITNNDRLAGGQGIIISNGYNVVNVPYGTGGSNQSGWEAATGDTTFSALGISGDPVDVDFKPVSSALNIVPSTLADFPVVDFYGNTRTFPAAPGAVSYE